MSEQRRATKTAMRGAQWWIAPDCDFDRSIARIDQALDTAQGQRPLSNGRRKESYRLSLNGSEPDHFLKVTHYDRGSSIAQRLRASKARREFDVAHVLLERGIDTPAPIAAGEVRRRGMLCRSYLLIPFDDTAVDLAEYTRNAAESASERNRVAAGFGTLARRLHDAGLLQPDFAPNNFLLRAGEPVAIAPIDFERASIHSRAGGVSRAQRVAMLAKLQRHLPLASPASRMRFLRSYADDRDGARELWREVAAEVPVLAARDHKRLIGVANSEGRRFRNAEFEGWTGWARRDSTRFDVACELLTREKTRSDPPLRIESRGGAWALAYREGAEPRAAEVWATAQILWNRALVPQPICALRRDRDFRVYFERDTESRTATGSAARAAVTVLIDRLLGLGQLSPELSRESVHACIGDDGCARAMLIDIAMFRTGATGTEPIDKARARAREICAELRV